MLNWIETKTRKPTREDANEFQLVYGAHNGSVIRYHISTFHDDCEITHWLPYKEMPLPKRWRVPTIHDLAKAGKPIPCRVRMSTKDYWVDRNLIAISVEQNDPMPFATSDEKWWQGCEICDE